MGALPLVTGGTGFAGSHLIDVLLESERAVAAWVNPAGQRREVGDGRVRWQSVDILDRGAVEEAIAELRPSAIYHCAGVADVTAAWRHPERALAVNALGTQHVLAAVERLRVGCPTIVTGSALVYRPSMQPLTEDSEIGPANTYGLSKLAQEMIALRASSASVFVVRAFNHAGPRQSDAYVTSGLARQIAEMEAQRREPVLHVGNLDARRDITDVRDTVRAYALLVKHGRPATPYNVCSGRAYAVRDLLDILIAHSRSVPTVQIDPSRLRPADNPLVVGDPSRIFAATGWRPEIPIERTLADLLDYWRQRIRASP